MTGSIPTRASSIWSPSSWSRCSRSGEEPSRGRGRRPAGGRSCERRPDPFPDAKRAGGAGIRRLVCIVLGPPDLTWPGGLSMPPAARLARGFCSPRSYLSIASSTVHPPDAVPQTAGQDPDAAGCSKRSASRSARSAASRGEPEDTARAMRRSSRSTVGAIRPARRRTTESRRPTARSKRRITVSSGFRRSRNSASETISPMGP
jgi:hypothetical protein